MSIRKYVTNMRCIAFCIKYIKMDFEYNIFSFQFYPMFVSMNQHISAHLNGDWPNFVTNVKCNQSAIDYWTVVESING